MQQSTQLEHYEEKRRSLLENICQVNAIANVEGKGRNDFNIALLLRSEELLQTAESLRYSRAVTKLATNVRTTFDAYRVLMRHY